MAMAVRKKGPKLRVANSQCRPLRDPDNLFDL
jgi:hypothetical protein